MQSKQEQVVGTSALEAYEARLVKATDMAAGTVAGVYAQALLALADERGSTHAGDRGLPRRALDGLIASA